MPAQKPGRSLVVMTALTDDLDDTPLVRAATQAARSLAEDASRLEREGVGRAVLDDLAAAGLLGSYGPPELGGAPAPVQRRVAELLSGASPDAWFVWFQHGPVVKMLSASDNISLQDRHLADLCTGRSLGGVAWSHLRTATPTVHAERVPGGWSLTGFQPWNTGWGLSDLVLVGALVRETDEVLFGLIRSGPQNASITFRDGRKVDGATPEDLTRRTLGWTVPLQGLRYWLDGLA